MKKRTFFSHCHRSLCCCWTFAAWSSCLLVHTTNTMIQRSLTVVTSLICVASMNHGYVTLSFLLFCPFIITPSYSHKCYNDIITFVTFMSWCKNWFEPRTPTVMLIGWFDRPERIVFGHKVYTTKREVVFVQPDWLAMIGKFFSKLSSWRDKIARREFSFRPCFWCIDRNTVIFLVLVWYIRKQLFTSES